MLSKNQQIKSQPPSPKLASNSKMFKGESQAVLTSNDCWPPHSPDGDFSNYPTREHLSYAEAVKYYPNGFPKDWNGLNIESPATAQVEAAQAAASEMLVDKLTTEKNSHDSRYLKTTTRNRLGAYIDAISEETPATPKPQHVLPAPLPTGKWPLILSPARGNTPPTTPTHKPRKSPFVHKPTSPADKTESPLRTLWMLPDSDMTSAEVQ